jgi:hypothetical protein
MTIKTLTLDLPEELLTKAEAQHLDLRQIMIDALSREVGGQGKALLSDSKPRHYPSVEEVERAVQESLARIAAGVTEQRILNLHAGGAWVSDDFDDPLPDEFWFGDETT